MMRVLWILLVVALVCSAGTVEAEKIRIGGRVLGQQTSLFPGDGAMPRNGCPVLQTCNAPDMKPGGVAFDGTHLWVGHYDTAPALIYKIDPVTCTVVHSIPQPTSPGNTGGLTWDGSALWCCQEQYGTLYRLDPLDGSVLHTIPTPSFGLPDPNDAGLAWDGQALWLVDYYPTPTIFKLDPSDGTVLHSFPSPVPDPSGLGFCSGNLVLGQFSTDNVYLVSPVTGMVISSCASPPGSWTWGIAVGGGGTWMAGFDTQLLHLLVTGTGPSATETSSWGGVKSIYR